MHSDSLRKLDIEIKRLKGLYVTSIYSFKEAAKQGKNSIYSGEVVPDEPVYLAFQNKEELIARNYYEFFNKTKSQFPRYLRETAFVRLISALEVFLIDVIKEVFVVRKDLFHSQGKIDFHMGEILSINSISELWSAIINREVRALHSKGFKEIVRYYKNRLDIDLTGFHHSINSLEELHDRRHILVHRLGYTDHEYKHKYNIKNKKLQISEEYYFDALNIVQMFGEYVASKAQKKITEVPVLLKKSEWDYEIKLEVTNDEVKPVLDKDYQYKVEDGIGCLSDILASYQIEDNKHILFLSGKRSNIKAYVNILKRFNRQNKLIIHSKELIGWEYRKRKCNLPDDLIKTIAAHLPKKPWPQGIHKEIAKKYQLPSSQVWAAVSRIIEDEQLYSLIGTE